MMPEPSTSLFPPRAARAGQPLARRRAGRRARASGRLLLALLLVAAASPALRAASPPVVYDQEFAGYVPIVDGIMRPDLTAVRHEGRVADEARRAARDARRELRRGLRDGSTIPEELYPPKAHERDDPSRRFLRRHAIVSELLVVDDAGFPLRGARVYRYHDPSFYAVNTDAEGARLVGHLRFLPRPNPVMDVIEAVRLHEEHWAHSGFASVIVGSADIDARSLAGSFRDRPLPESDLAYLGRTDESGRLRSVSGIFAIADDDRFPRAIVPGTLGIGFVVTAPGFRPAFSERRFTEGGVKERRRVALVRDRSHELVTSRVFLVAEEMSRQVPIPREANFSELLASLEPILERVRVEAARARESDEAEARSTGAARIIAKVARRAPADLQEPLARLALERAGESPARLYRLALALAAGEGVFPGDWTGATLRHTRRDAGAAQREREPPPALAEAELLARRALERWPRFLPAYPLLDALLLARDAPRGERIALLKQLLGVAPFEPWGRGRLAALLLEEDRRVEAFDHLRYTRVTIPGRAGDLVLARALADYYWRLGAVEKAGFWPFFATGRVPEDPGSPAWRREARPRSRLLGVPAQSLEDGARAASRTHERAPGGKRGVERELR